MQELLDDQFISMHWVEHINMIYYNLVIDSNFFEGVQWNPGEAQDVKWTYTNFWCNKMWWGMRCVKDKKMLHLSITGMQERAG